MLERFTWFRQSALRWADDDLAIYIDPWGLDEGSRPADALFITHAHIDHLLPDDIARVQTPATKVFAPSDVAAGLTGDVTVVAPGEYLEVLGVHVQTVPAYNTAEERLGFHPKSNRWVGYILSLEGRDYYHAGDTDHLPELESIASDVSFVPIGGYYTMDSTEAGGFIKAQQPKLAVPIHFGFVEGVGDREDAARFAAASAPVPVEVMSSTNEQFGHLSPA